MVFSSSIFMFLFLPIVLMSYFLCNPKLKNIVLLLSSLFFYAWGEPSYVIIMIISIIVNYYLGIFIDKSDRKKVFLILAILFNIGFLIYFKYFGFIISNVNKINSIIGMGNVGFKSPALPIGISFYTFQALSYIVDIYRGEVRCQKNILNLGLYVSLFPQLVAGPIVRYKDIDMEINARVESLKKIEYGIKRFILGMGKKIIISNQLAFVADNIFSLQLSELSFISSWIGIICYTLQLYFDFSGYSDMAIGLGRIFGFTFMENFNYPYISKSIKEFWRRWHISLSSWFRDYVYISLGGNRGSKYKVYRNLSVVFLLTGIWHGASWNFVVWGLYHGIFILMERAFLGKYLEKIYSPFSHIYTLLVVTVGWVFFRTESLGYAIDYIRVMFNISNISLEYEYFYTFMNYEVVFILIVAILGSMPIYTYIIDKGNRLTGKWHGISNFVEYIYIYIVFIISIASLASSTYNPFIYFRF